MDRYELSEMFNQSREYAITKKEVRHSIFMYSSLVLVPANLFMLMYHQLLKYGAKQEITWHFWVQVIFLNAVIVIILFLIFRYLNKKGKIPFVVPGDSGFGP